MEIVEKINEVCKWKSEKKQSRERGKKVMNEIEVVIICLLTGAIIGLTLLIVAVSRDDRMWGKIEW